MEEGCKGMNFSFGTLVHRLADVYAGNCFPDTCARRRRGRTKLRTHRERRDGGRLIARDKSTHACENRLLLRNTRRQGEYH